MPWLAALIPAAVSGITAAASAASGSGKAQGGSNLFYGTPGSGADKNAVRWGPYAGFGETQRKRYEAYAGALGNRQGPQIDMANAKQTRAQQEGLISQLQDAAAGKGPTAAQGQMQLGMDQARMQQQSMAAGATGAGAANAQRQAAMNTQMGQQQSVNQAAVLRAQEQQGAQQNLGQVLGQTRGQDFGEQQGLVQQQMQFQQLNDQLRMYYEKMGFDATTADAQARQSAQQMMMQDWWNSQNAKSGQAAQNAQQDQRNIGLGLSGINTSAGLIGGMYAPRPDPLGGKYEPQLPNGGK